MVRLTWPAYVSNWSHAAPTKTFVDLAGLLCSISMRSVVGEPGSSAAALRLESAAPAATVLNSRPILLDDVEAALAGMETCIDPRPAGNCCPMASAWLSRHRTQFPCLGGCSLSGYGTI